MPDAKAVFQGLTATIVIEIALPAPRGSGPFHINLDPGARGHTVPDMMLPAIERKGRRVERFGMDPHGARHTPAAGDKQALVAFFDIDLEAIAVPAHRARPDLEV